ncbi:hypothetical protein AMTR_s00027p00103070 [Amborella trichopoda]|uniref:Secreted protein n=1 Tax=Amborella trichopoda TaxID=13333 RepID=W1PRS5_AMBTC|nr:hypothetical protein AMTR_s00027p00103070 [Amborella trichopoda]
MPLASAALAVVTSSFFTLGANPLLPDQATMLPFSGSDATVLAQRCSSSHAVIVQSSHGDALVLAGRYSSSHRVMLTFSRGDTHTAVMFLTMPIPIFSTRH